MNHECQQCKELLDESLGDFDENDKFMCYDCADQEEHYKQDIIEARWYHSERR
jgi:hypothetical protein